ncbi:MAG TPA: DUF2157 domain-containing protein [Thermoanaerobaculia bacterium]
MLSLEPEVLQIGREGLIGEDTAGLLAAQERREIVSIYPEVRTLAWLGVMLIAGGVGVIVSKNLERIGPVVIASAIGVASLACYGYCVRRRASAIPHSLDDYVLLLGALLLSADLGYIEHQFDVLGSEWPAHFLVLAIVHGATAYFFGSAALLSLSIAALASWFGIERNVETFFTDSLSTALRAFACAGVVALWRAANRRAAFELVFDHFIANLAMWGGLILTFRRETQEIGALVVLVFAALAIAYGFRKREQAFVIYAYVYAVAAVEVLAISHLHGETVVLTYLVVSLIAAIAGLFAFHARFRRSAA